MHPALWGRCGAGVLSQTSSSPSVHVVLNPTLSLESYQDTLSLLGICSGIPFGVGDTHSPGFISPYAHRVVDNADFTHLPS